jgi:DNA-binding response OmpR family regulator
MNMQYLKDVELIFLWNLLNDKFQVDKNSQTYNKFKKTNNSLTCSLWDLLRFFNTNDMLESLSLFEQQLGMRNRITVEKNKIVPITFDYQGVSDYGSTHEIKDSMLENTNAALKRLPVALQQCQTITDLSSNWQIVEDLKTTLVSLMHITITITNFKQFKERIQTFFDEYIEAYENNQLHEPHISYYNKELNLKLLLQVLRKYENKGPNNIIVCGTDFSSTAHTLPVSESGVELYRPLETILLAKKKNYLAVKDLHKLIEADEKEKSKVPFPLLSWTVTIDCLKTPVEIELIEGSWLRFGNLAVREDTGHAVYKNNKHNFQKDLPGFKALVLFIKNPGKKFTRKELEEHCFADTSPNKNALKTKTENLIHKTIMENLGLNKPGADITIHGSGDTYQLIAVPVEKPELQPATA